jgi:hypothetical protein
VVTSIADLISESKLRKKYLPKLGIRIYFLKEVDLRSVRTIQGSNFDPEKLLHFMHLLFVSPIKELVYGFRAKTIPLQHCMMISLLFQLFFLFDIDIAIIDLLKLNTIYPNGIFYSIYLFFICISGFVFWAYLQVVLKIRLTTKLTAVFSNAGLKNLLGKLPNYIFDRPIDEYARRMRLSRNNFPLKTFKEAKHHLESGLNVYIDDFREDRSNGTVDIVYSHTELKDNYTLEGIDDLGKDTFVIGKSRGPVVKKNFSYVPHLLIAGQTGGGKSTFLRQYITSLYINNPKYKFTLIDLKGGLEFQLFENLKNIEVSSSVRGAISELDDMANKVIERRMRLLKENRCKDLDAFRKLDKEKIVYPEGVCRTESLDRHILVVDEAAELFMAGSFANVSEVKAVRRCANKIAAQGRAVGVNIIIATQRPDRFSVDPLTKANLPGILCFRQPNLATSRTVLDSGRAHELPNIKGRGIWKCENQLIEVQTPFFTEEDANKLLDPLRSKVNKKIIENDIDETGFGINS